MPTRETSAQGIRLPTSAITLEDLREAERTQRRRKDTPTQLRLDDIHIADKAFQWRLPGEDINGSAEHIKVLKRAIGRGSRPHPLDALLVTAVGERFYLIDGFHRLAAYRAADWQGSVPVEVFNGSVDAAQDEAFARNKNDKKPLSTEAKNEAVWKRLRDGTTWSKLKDIYGASQGTLARMAKKLRDIEATGQDAKTITWTQARRLDWTPDADYDSAAVVDENARALAGRLATVSNFAKDPEVTAKAIGLVNATLPLAMMQEWTLEAAKATAGWLRDQGKDDLADELDEALERAFDL